MTETREKDPVEIGANGRRALDHKSVISAYRRYGRLYNLVFGRIFEPGRRRLLDAMDCQPGDRVLELGVGTGLSLPRYPQDVEITGIDLSPDMLEQAAEVVERNRLDNVQLIEMDAQELAFADDSYDKVAVMYVASVVPDPRAMIQEVRRVCRPGGDIFVLNHFASQGNRLLRRGENMLAPMSRALGFHPHFELDDFIEMAGLPVEDISPVNAFGYWTLLHLKNR